MNPKLNEYTVALPWYDRADFERIREIADDCHDSLADYETWRLQALEVARSHLASGRALQLIAVKPDEFIAWLGTCGLPNTAATRRQYVEYLATRGPTAMAVSPEELAHRPAGERNDH